MARRGNSRSASASASRKNLTDYQYGLYKDYLEQTAEILTKYGNQSGLSIEYWHIKVDLSKNYDGLEETKLQNAYKHYVYDLFHFIPTINMTPLTYQIGYDPQKQGTSNIASGSFSMFLIDKPLPGDIFRFYPYDGTTERTELFRVTNVRYMRTSMGKLNLYQVDFESAPMYVDTIEHVRINEIYCWDTENFEFLNEDLCEHKGEIIDCREQIVDWINNWYDEQNGWYGLCREGPGTPVDWENICGDETPEGPNWPGVPVGPDWPAWPPGPGFPGWPEVTIPEWPDNTLPSDRVCSDGTARPLVFLNTILKRLKKIFPTLELKPIFGIGTAKIPIEWILPAYEVPDPNNPDGPPIIAKRDYWDTFTCLSYQPESTAGELFNLSEILKGECGNCPPELIEELECHRELYMLVLTLIKLLEPLMTEEQLKDRSCDRKCCDMFDPNFVANCIVQASSGTNEAGDLFWDYQGSLAGENPIKQCQQFENMPCSVPLYLTFRDGAVWPQGGKVVGG